MNEDTVSLASSYYEIIEGLSVIWEETSQDLRSIVTNPKYQRRLSNGPLPYPPASPRLSPRSVEGKPRIKNLIKSPMIKKNVRSPLLKKDTISEYSVELKDDNNNNNNNNNNERSSVLVTSLRTGELIALPLQDDEYTFESCTTGSDMQSVESLEEYFSDEEQPQSNNNNTTSRRNRRKEEPTEDETIFEIVDELKEELLMIKHARDEAMKALYLHESSHPTAESQRNTASRSEEFLSRLSTTTRIPHFGNNGEISDSSSLPDILPSSKKISLKDAPSTSVKAKDANLSLPTEVSSSIIDSNLPETDSKDASSAIKNADAAYHASLPDLSSMTERSSPQGIDVGGGGGGALQRAATSNSALDAPPSAIDSENTPGRRESLSGEETPTGEESSSSQMDMTFKTTSQIPKSEIIPSKLPPIAGPISPEVECGTTNVIVNVDASNSLEAGPILDSAAQQAEATLNASDTDTMPNVQQESEATIPEVMKSKGNLITPAPNFALMKKWLQSNFKPSFFDVEQRQVFRSKIDMLGGQRRRVQYNSSRLLLKKRLRKYLKAQSRRASVQSPQNPSDDPLHDSQPDMSDDDSIDILIANPQDDSQDDIKSLPGRRRRLRRSTRRRSESDLGSLDREENKRDELRSKLDNIEDKLNMILMNLSNSFSSFATLESGDGKGEAGDGKGEAGAKAEKNKPMSRTWSSRSFSEGVIPQESSPKARKELKGRLERIRGKKKMNLEKLQHALDSAMEAISAGAES